MSVHCLRLRAPAKAQEIFEEALARFGGAVVIGLPDRVGEVPIELYLEGAPAHADVTAALAAAALASGVPAPGFALEPVEERDWVAESQAALPPIRAGRFYVYGSHVAEPPPAASVPLLVDANIAFGTGRHETTRGCLLAITALDKAGGVAGPLLDLGCGSGILAMAMAKRWRRRVVATDIDPDSVLVTARNARLNGLGGLVAASRGEGYRAELIRRNAPYGLIVANILAAPLCDMARDLRKHLRPGGLAILSGLLTSQEGMVLGKHRAVGLSLVRRWRLGDWSTLLLRR